MPRSAASTRFQRGNPSPISAVYHRTVSQAILFVLAIPILIITIRLAALAIGITAGSNFADFWYTLSAPFVSPFVSLTGEGLQYQVYTGARLEFASLLVLLVLIIIAYVGVRVGKLINRRNEA